MIGETAALAAPDIAGTIDAWRAWIVTSRRGELGLTGVVYKVWWPPERPLVATCMRRAGRLWARLRGRWPHDAPAFGCTCGAYATNLERVAGYLTSEWGETSVRAFGTVALWGSVVECEHGWRASHAYPKRLYVAAATAGSRVRAAEIVMALEQYRVPVELVDGNWAEALSHAARG